MGILIYEALRDIPVENLIKHYKITVIQELLDYIHHLESTITNLHKEGRNYQLSLSDFNNILSSIQTNR